MMDAAIIPLKEHFSSLEDSRAQHSIEHLLLDLVLITICAVICGADNWVEIENYGIAKQEWLSTFLELPNGIPSHDTLERTFARLRPEQVQQCFLNWVQAVFNTTNGQLMLSDNHIGPIDDCIAHPRLSHVETTFSFANRIRSRHWIHQI